MSNKKPTCQHGNEAAACTVPCGTFEECAHPCCEHEPYEPVDDGVVYDVRRACLRADCQCGKYSDLATEEEARGFGDSFGRSYAADFIAHPEWRGPKFDWNNMERSAREMAVVQWHMAARYGHEQAVADAAAQAWLASNNDK